MKKLLAVLGVMAIGGGVMADELQDNVGIGFGTMIFQGQTGLVQQVLAATTNSFLGNQTFAISSGTLDAKKPDSLVENKALREFVAGNMDNLAKDIAMGRGETLDTVTELMAVPEGKRAEFHKNLQANFSNIYSSESVTHLDVLNNLEQIAI
ncbi:MAG: hypothetical protein A3K19_22645 [Lentisphaerae bacterium RIFOXYB12_FULL_65_16]|nr:MAG: hypothetical protein A3K18_17110 [Lentisphaerae bacterium RIFOXYA12_64_32]OGV90013.1 MAG: hypothetical protein A3K19_22645 [Lentisphaerae bacterium RIFOXYB12_FULL_65_16]